MHSIQKLVSGATFRGWIAPLLFVIALAISGTEIASADSGVPIGQSTTGGAQVGFYPTVANPTGSFYTGQSILYKTQNTTQNIETLVVRIAEIVGGAPDIKPFGFQFTKNGNFINCLSAFKTANLWGIAQKPSYTNLVVPLHGTQCDSATLDDGTLALRSVSATNTNTSIIGTEVEWYGYGTWGFATFNSNYPYNPLGETFEFSTTTQSPIQLKTHFISLTTSGVGTAGGTEDITLNAEYFLDPTEINTSIASRNPVTVDFEISLRPNSTVTVRGENINGDFSTSTKSTTFTGLVNGVYDVYVHFDNSNSLFGGEIPFKDIYLYSSFTISNGVLTEVGQTENYDTTQNLDSTILPCSLSNFGNCIINAFSYLFVPSTESTQQFSTTFATLADKAPFVYIYQVQNEITTMWNTPSSFPTISIPFGSFGNITLLSAGLISAVPFVGLIRTILGALIWIIVAMTIYKKTLRIFENTTA